MKGAGILLLILAVVIAIYAAVELTGNYQDREFERKLMRDHPSLIGSSTFDSSLRTIREIDGKIERNWYLVIFGVCAFSASLVLFSKAKKKTAPSTNGQKTA